MLVLWGHAYDFAIGRRATGDGTIDALDFVELSAALQPLREKLEVSGGKLDILACDACDLSTVEMACQIEPFAKYLSLFTDWRADSWMAVRPNSAPAQTPARRNHEPGGIRLLGRPAILRS